VDAGALELQDFPALAPHLDAHALDLIANMPEVHLTLSNNRAAYLFMKCSHWQADCFDP
jgi:hypothetical protein